MECTAGLTPLALAWLVISKHTAIERFPISPMAYDSIAG